MVVNFLSLSLASSFNSHKELFWELCSQSSQRPLAPPIWAVCSWFLAIVSWVMTVIWPRLGQSESPFLTIGRKRAKESLTSLLQRVGEKGRASLSHSRGPGEQHAGKMKELMLKKTQRASPVRAVAHLSRSLCQEPQDAIDKTPPPYSHNTFPILASECELISDTLWAIYN